ncbi:MAG: aminotransferase class IV family protein [Mesorhizobium sp.]|nr:aminotransferase class IV family protein [Mesorhizobium sp.]MBL8578270.1 aminotransferase class IV family protein [Mesorhizobium sp.]
MPAEGSIRDGTTADFDLIETLRWQPGDGFVRLDRHLQRLYSSAAALGFAADPDSIGAALGKCRGDATLRVRLALSRDGAAEATTTPFEPLVKDAVWALRIAQARLDSTDLLLRHKTTRRHIYDAARAEFPREQADEVLLLNERGEISEGTITNLFINVGDPVLVTPPLTSGLLAGVLRGSMLDAGAAREAALTEADLRSAQAIFVGNSLRGLIRAKLV